VKPAIGVIGFLLLLVLWATAAVSDRCVVCQQKITERVYLFTNPYVAEKQPVCSACAQLETTCATCTLPVRSSYAKFADGRLLCANDAREAVLTHDALEEIFREVKRDLFRMLNGHVLPDKNITVELATRTDLDRVTRSQRFPHDKQLTLGVTQTRQKNKEFEHRISVLVGLPKSRVAAVCAHEYTHAWLHENVAEGRRLDSDTVEGFCELVAFKLVSDRNHAVEKKIILENSYTSGQVHSLVKAEDRYRFTEIVKWIKDGVDDKIDLRNTARVLVRKTDDRPMQVAWQPAKPTAVPNTLVLRGISGTPQRRFALINDATLEKGEQAKVRVGSTKVVVRCLEISDTSVTLTVNGASEQTQLSLNR
jgi:hypothetical protein